MIQIIVALILSIVIFFLLLVIISAFFFTIDVFLDLPYVATDRRKIATIIKLAHIKAGETVIDLGSGDGRLLFAAARRGAKAIGYEINPFLIWSTRLRSYLTGYSSNESDEHRTSREVMSSLSEAKDLRVSSREPRTISNRGSVTINRQNLWQADLSQADVIFVYGRRKTMQKFQDFVYQNAKRGARIVVNTNPFSTKKPLKSENGVFLYKV